MGDRLSVTAIIATTRPQKKYAGLVLAPSALENMRDNILAKRARTQMQHDSFRPIDVDIEDAWVEETDDGEHELRMRYTVDEELHSDMEAEFAAAGGPGGFSFGGASLQEVIQSADRPQAATLHLAADFGGWDDEARREAGRALAVLGPVEVQYYLEFGIADTAKVVLELPLEIWRELAIGVAAQVVAEAIFSLVRRRKGVSVVEFLRTTDVGTSIARVRTKDPEIVKAAALGLKTLAAELEEGNEQPANREFHEQRSLWLPPGARDDEE